MIIYYSRSNEVDDDTILPQLERLRNQIERSYCTDVEITMHQEGGDYNKNLPIECNLMVVGTIDKNFHDDLDEGDVGKGCFTEIGRAHKADIPVLVLGKGYGDDYFIQNINKDDCNVHNTAIWTAGYGRMALYSEYDKEHDDQDYELAKLDNDDDLVQLLEFLNFDPNRMPVIIPEIERKIMDLDIF